jgi:hypothetical protein
VHRCGVPDTNSFCAASALSVAEQHIPETAYTDGDGNAQVFPETRLVYQWSELRMYTTYSAPEPRHQSGFQGEMRPGV